MRFITAFAALQAAAAQAQWDGTASPHRLRLNLWADTMMVNAVDMAHCHDGRMFIVERHGSIRIVTDSGTVLGTPFLSVNNLVYSTAGESGLLGMTFDPDFANNGFFYVNYTGLPGPGTTRIARYSVSADPNIAQAASGHIIYSWPQPYNNHNGGDLDFGPDGNLWFPLGDGGGSGDPQNHAQDLRDPLGDLVRIHPESDSTYSIPLDNPYVNTNNDTLPEIYASGFRNPFRFGFDRLTGDIWIGDVGQGTWEEVDVIPAGIPGGQNFGWRCREGISPFNTTGCQPAAFYDPPIKVHPNTPWCAIIGGRVYRGNEIPWLYGRYVYTDYCLGQLHTLEPDGSGGWSHDSLLVSGNPGLTFIAEDSAGTLFTADRILGKLYRIEDACPYDALVITENGASLDAPDGLAWQWYLDDVAIEGANGPSFEPPITGDYHAVVLLDSTCALTSNTITFISTAASVVPRELFHVAPVPANDQLAVNWPSSIGVAALQLVDALGTVRADQPVSGSSAVLSTGRIPAGSHVLMISDRDGHVLFRQPIVVAH